MVEGDGFEPSKAVPADLQSDPFGHSGTPSRVFILNSRFPNTLTVLHSLLTSNCVKYGGGGRIRTIEGASRFTIRSLWPLGNLQWVFYT